MTTFVFPGQGSQIKGMGKELFAEFPEFVQKADQILGYSIADMCINNPDNLLNDTRYTQPAIFVVSVLSYLNKIKQTSDKPSYLVGHSLGEYTALFAANVFDFESGLKLIQKRGELMSQAKGGGMAALIGLQQQQVEQVLAAENMSAVNIANYNSYTQIVISGAKEKIEQSIGLFEKAGAKVFPLNVSGAFHSPLMLPAQNEFANFIKNFTFSTPTIPVIANITAAPYTADNIQDNLIKQISQSVRFTQSIAYLLQQGEKVFEELGPGKVLTGLIRRIQMGQ